MLNALMRDDLIFAVIDRLVGDAAIRQRRRRRTFFHALASDDFVVVVVERLAYDAAATLERHLGRVAIVVAAVSAPETSDEIANVAEVETAEV